MSDAPASVTIRQIENYRFEVEFEEILPSLIIDENAPVGAGDGPDPVKLLLTAVAHCLSSSLLFALRKFKNDPHNISATTTATIGRNDHGRLRVASIDAAIRLGDPAETYAHLDRVAETFEEFCTVTGSVRQGITVNVRVEDSLGRQVK